MLYQSSRDPSHRKFTSAETIQAGLAPDGGLFLPERLPALTPEDLLALNAEPYPARAAAILSLFLTDYPYAALLEDCRAAYSEAAFPGGPAPVSRLGDLYCLELFHGPTAAFKDMALQLMPRLLSRALEQTGERRDALILVATSGDTGKAALEGCRDAARMRIAVFYPAEGVSCVQRLQMATQEGRNVAVYAVRGNFDDAQAGVKRIFGDPAMRAELDRRGFLLSSANSINWGRLAPQIVYYASAYCDLLAAGALSLGDPLDVCVPTGNFGNILAAYLAQRMGLPLRRLVCASNRNRVLTDFFETGVYDRNRPFRRTISPSMDILVSSNLERLLCLEADERFAGRCMERLRADGAYAADEGFMERIRTRFAAYSADEAETSAAIRDAYRTCGRLIDPHTAVAYSCAQRYRRSLPPGDDCPLLVVSTASPFKFALDVYAALRDGPLAAIDPLAAIGLLSEATGEEPPAPLRGLGARAVRFTDVIDPEDMPAAVLGGCP